MAELETRTENAFVEFLLATDIHGETIGGITPRRFEKEKDDQDTGVLDPVTLPKVVVKATIGRQLHYQVAVYEMDVTVTYSANADDTTTAVWDAVCEAVETILMTDDLAQRITSTAAKVRCYGVPRRMPRGKVISDRHWSQEFSLVVWMTRKAGA